MSRKGDEADPYAAAGVDYARLDAGKRLALAMAVPTSEHMRTSGARAMDATRGEPAFVFHVADHAFAFVLEGLGTKSMIARAYLAATGEYRFNDAAYDTVAAILNDLICVGAMPIVVNAYFATGGSDWYDDDAANASLLRGWRRACDDARCTWGGGESPSLSGLVTDGEIELAGSALGLLPPGVAPIVATGLAPGNDIVFVESTGLHANGASLARRVGETVPGGYLAPLPSGITFGDALLTPAPLYVRLVGALLASSLPVTYLSHITGHGLLKLMRPPRDLTYRVTRLPQPPEVLTFLVEASGLTAEEAYKTLNMGVGFVIYCEAGAGESIAKTASSLGYSAFVAGAVEQGPRRVVLEPVGIDYSGDQLSLK